MAKPRKKDNRGPLQRLYDTSRTEADQSSLDVLTEAQKAKPEYAGNGRTFRRNTLLDRWFEEGGPGFGEGAHRVVADCEMFWNCMANPRLIAHYGERVALSTHDEGYSAQEAADEIAFRKKLVPREYFEVFENVVRHHEPAGVAGSSFATNTPQQIASAKVIVGFVASTIAMKLGY